MEIHKNYMINFGYGHLCQTGSGTFIVRECLAPSFLQGMEKMLQISA